MKHLLKLLQFSILIVLLFNSACREKNKPLPEPSISDFSPKTGTKNTVITIDGDGFGTDASKIIVYVNNKEAELVSVTNTSITAKVPARAFTGVVSVSVDGVATSYGVAFEYITSTAQVNNVTSLVSGSASLFFDPNNILYVANNSNVNKLTLNQAGVNNQLIASATSGLSSLSGIVLDGTGNIYVSELHKISKINTSGVVSTIAGTINSGSTDGNGVSASFNKPNGLGFNGSNNLIVADLGNSKLRKVDIATNAVTTYYTGNIQNPKNFFFKDGLCYIADQGNYQIKKLSSNGSISTFAGSILGYEDGLGTAAKFGSNLTIASDNFGNTFVADKNNFCIRIISRSGRVSTLIGGTTSIVAGAPDGIAVDSNGDIYYYDASTGLIRRVVFE
jgi:serine/threonine protein kinase, bacterial